MISWEDGRREGFQAPKLGKLILCFGIETDIPIPRTHTISLVCNECYLQLFRSLFRGVFCFHVFFTVFMHACSCSFGFDDSD
jgi:hypothetical protein